MNKVQVSLPPNDLKLSLSPLKNTEIKQIVQRTHKQIPSQQISNRQSLYSTIYYSLFKQKVSQHKSYDSQYKNGYPKLYCYDILPREQVITKTIQDNQVGNQNHIPNGQDHYLMNGPNLSNTHNQTLHHHIHSTYEHNYMSSHAYNSVSNAHNIMSYADKKSINTVSKKDQNQSKVIKKYSFRDSRLTRQSLLRSTPVVDQNKINSQLNFLKTQISRLTSLLNTKDNTIKRLEDTKVQNQVVYITKSQPYERKATQVRFSQINQSSSFESERKQLNLQIINLKNQLNLQSFQYNESLNQLNIQINSFKQQISQLTIINKQQISIIRNLQIKLTNQSANVKIDPQINVLNDMLKRLKQQNSLFKQKTQKYKQQISFLRQHKCQEKPVENQPTTQLIKDQPNAQLIQIIQYQGLTTSLKSQINTLKRQISTLKSQMSTLKSTLSENQEEISHLLEQIGHDKSQLISFKTTINQYESQIYQLQQQIADYSYKIQNLQRVNIQLLSRLSSTNQPSQILQVQQHQQFMIQTGKSNLKIIILMEQINRLNQKINYLEQKAQQYYGYLLNAQNHIDQIQTQLNQYNLKEYVPAHIAQRILQLQQEIHRLTAQNAHIVQLQQKINHLTAQNSYNAQRIVQFQQEIDNLTVQNGSLKMPVNPLVDSKVSQRNKPIPSSPFTDSRIKNINQISNLYDKIEQLQFLIQDSQKNLFNAQNHIQYLQGKIKQLQKPRKQVLTQKVAESVQQQIARFTLKSIILLQQINRLNQQGNIIKGYLVQAQDHIQIQQNIIHQLNQNQNQNQNDQKTLKQVNQKMRLLVLQKQRLQNLVKQLNKLVKDKNQTKIVYQTPEEVEKLIAKLTLRCIIRLEEINRLNIEGETIKRYLVEAQDYIQQCHKIIEQLKINTNNTSHSLSQVNIQMSKLVQQKQKLQRLVIELRSKSPTNQQPNQPQIIYQTPQAVERQIARLTLRCIMLLQQINRLNQSDQLIKGYLVNAEDHIQVLEAQLRQQANVRTQIVLKEVIKEVPKQIIRQVIVPHQTIKQVITYVPKQIIKQVIKEVPKQTIRQVIKYVPTQIIKEVIKQVPKEITKEVIKEVTKEVIKQVYRTPVHVQTELRTLIKQKEELQKLIIQLNKKLSQVQTHSTTQTSQDIQKEIARLSLRSIILLEQINRLNQQGNTIKGYLVSAENHIQQCQKTIFELNETKVSSTIYKVPEQVQLQLNSLISQNQLLKQFIQQVAKPLKKQQTKVITKIQYKIPQEIQFKLNQLVEQNQKLIKLIQFQKSQDFVTQYGKLQLKVIILLEEINRLNQQTNTFKNHLINAENYIYQMQNNNILTIGQTQSNQLIMQNQRLLNQIKLIRQTYEQQITQLGLEIQSYTTQITSYKTQIISYTTQIASFTTQIATYTTQINNYKNQINLYIQRATQSQENQSEIQIMNQLKNKIQSLHSQISLATQQKQIILSHLYTAQNYIRQLQQNPLSNNNQQQRNQYQQQLNQYQQQLTQYQQQLTQYRIAIASKDLRVIFLLQEINRLNYKEKQILNAVGSSRLTTSTNQEIQILRKEKQLRETQIQQILAHLRIAQTYIRELTQQNQKFINQRNYLINQLNNMQ